MSAQNAANVVHVRNLEQERLLKCYFQIEKKMRIFENSRVKKNNRIIFHGSRKIFENIKNDRNEISKRLETPFCRGQMI